MITQTLSLGDVLEHPESGDHLKIYGTSTDLKGNKVCYFILKGTGTYGYSQIFQKTVDGYDIGDYKIISR